MFEKIKRFYKFGLWSESMVNDAVYKGVLTQAEANNIINYY